MIRFAFTFAFVVLAGAAGAQSVKLTPMEVEILLSGNTAVGKWDGIKYRQYFSTDDVTIYAQQDARSARGQWRVQEGEYQSRWPGEADWQGWFVMEYGGVWCWISKATPPTPFQVLQGEQLLVE